MARRRLTDEEREAKRRARFSDQAYSHYDPAKEGYGSAADWVAAAERLAAGHGTVRRIAGRSNPDLAVLGLDDMPESLSQLKLAFRNSIRASHPDFGGTNDAAREVMEAYKRLLAHF